MGVEGVRHCPPQSSPRFAGEAGGKADSPHTSNSFSGGFMFLSLLALTLPLISMVLSKKVSQANRKRIFVCGLQIYNLSVEKIKPLVEEIRRLHPAPYYFFVCPQLPHFDNDKVNALREYAYKLVAESNGTIALGLPARRGQEDKKVYEIYSPSSLIRRIDFTAPGKPINIKLR